MQFFDPSTLPFAISIPKKNTAKTYSKVYQDLFEPEFTDRICEEMTDDEIVAHQGKVLLFDTECYTNYWCCLFKVPGTSKVISFELFEDGKLNVNKLAWVMANFCVVGYYSIAYDSVMIQLALLGKGTRELHAVSCSMIVGEFTEKPWAIRRKYKISEPRWNHIDLIEVAPLQGSLKLYAGRLHCERMQDLPYDPLTRLEPEQILTVFKYCINDLFSTDLLFEELKPPLELRYTMTDMYGVDVRSRSDAQIAEYVIKSEIQKVTGTTPERPHIAPGTIFKYNVPSYIRYNNPILKEMLEVVRNAFFRVGEDGYITMPETIGNLKLGIGNCIYYMGIGGLHSSEKSASHVSDDDWLIVDRDVASFYPRIILNQRLYPQHLGPVFLDVYDKIVNNRLDNKRWAGELEDLKSRTPEQNRMMKIFKGIASSLKIVVNGSFGKLGSKWSVLYAPDLMIQVTISGQLSLLMLIDMVESAGIRVISGNTDGVIFKCHKRDYDKLNEIVKLWEQLTSFETEETKYRAVYSRDVNNYIAIKQNGKSKVKGTYAERGSAGDSILSKNPENLICNDALIAFLETGKAIEDTIRSCKDIRRFVTIRNVTGGARKSSTRLGKVVRWYYSTEMLGEINSIKSGNKVANSDRVRPLMELPKEFPGDVDFDRYIAVANGMLLDLGAVVQGANAGFAFTMQQ